MRYLREWGERPRARAALVIAALLATLPRIGSAQGALCRNAVPSANASAYVWVDHAFIPTPKNIFSLIVPLPPGARPPTAVEIGRGDRWWRARVFTEKAGSARARALRVRTMDDAPDWLKRVDSVHVCLLLDSGHSRRLIRLPTVEVLYTS